MAHPDLIQAVKLAAAGRDAEAVRIVARLADAGDREALFIFGDMHWRGGPVAQDHGRARALFEAADRAGHPRAAPIVTNLLASGIAGPRDWRAAIERLRREAAADAGRAATLALLDRMVLDDEGDPAALPAPELLSKAPHVTRFAGVLTPAECDYLIALGETGFAPAMVNNGMRLVRDSIRTSDGASMHWLIEDPAVHALNRRIAALSGSRVEQGEPLFVLRYRPGQEYRRHYDWTGEANARVQTALVYLNQGYGGGETEFPKVGLKVQGRRGDVLLFRNAGADGKLDPLTEHAGLPVLGGVKYLATRWIRERRHVP